MKGTQPTCRCPIDCNGLKPGKVCGSNGQTYASVCELQVVACTTNRLVKVQKLGQCPPSKWTSSNKIAKAI